MASPRPSIARRPHWASTRTRSGTDTRERACLMAESNRLDEFVRAVTSLVEQTSDESRVVAGCRGAMKRLVASDDWLPEAMTRPHPQYYQQYLLYCDPAERFSVVSF